MCKLVCNDDNDALLLHIGRWERIVEDVVVSVDDETPVLHGTSGEVRNPSVDCKTSHFRRYHVISTDLCALTSLCWHEGQFESVTRLSRRTQLKTKALISNYLSWDSVGLYYISMSQSTLHEPTVVCREEDVARLFKTISFSLQL